jgi:predicted amidohydrolase
VTHSIKAAAIQLDATPAPTADRLACAERLIVDAAHAGAQLIVLPELFNLGYTYSDENFRRAETLNGLTASWMKDLASRLKIHLAGSLLVIERADIYNALLLFAPDGRMWRYDKNYPWGWERAYFREGHGIAIARTDLGDIGLLICWDVAHPVLWKRYAGQIDLMLISSCPPDVSNPIFHFADGERVTFDQLGPFVRKLKDAGRKVFDEGIDRQTAWLRVPAIHASVAGTMTTSIPNARGSMLVFAFLAPKLIKYLPQAHQLKMTCDMIRDSKVVDASGHVLSKLTDGEGLIISDITLAEKKPQPIGPQPKRGAPWLSYFASDVALPLIARSTYRHRSDRSS